MIANEQQHTAAFLHTAVQRIGGFTDPGRTTLMDFGCGGGQLVQEMLARGYDAHGCDVMPYWQTTSAGVDQRRFGLIEAQPYRLPFPDSTFDVVVSTSVWEHAQNTREFFLELHRVLRPGGVSMHLYPGKWYLPYEPHIYVPLVNFFWPHCPRWWLALWARLGVRNEFQQGKPWREVVEVNERYCQTGLIYLTNARYRQLSREVFGGSTEPMAFFIEHGYGGVAQLARKLPFTRLSGWLCGQLRMNFIVQRKQ